MSLSQIQSKEATVIMFLCNHCPYVKYIQQKLLQVIQHYQSKGIAFVAINSNDAEKYPADNPANMKKQAEEYHYTFPYLYDETQDIAKKYHAACTPDFFVFDSQLKCVYRGRFDQATPGNQFPVTGEDLCRALDAVLNNEAIDRNQKPSLGCNIKWK